MFVRRPNVSDKMAQLDDSWNSTGDNKFAMALFHKVDSSAVLPPLPATANVCVDCSLLDIWTGGFVLNVRASKLQAQCRLCTMFRECIIRHGKGDLDAVKFYRIESTFCFSRYEKPILSIIGHPGTFFSKTAATGIVPRRG